MANKAIDKHYLLETLKDFYTTILLTFFQKKLTVTTVPSDPANGDVIIYVGITSGDFIQGHTYKYASLPGEWTDITPADGGTWGTITGTLSDQTDLQTVLDEKAIPIKLSTAEYNSLSPSDKNDSSKIYFVADKDNSINTMTWSGLTSFDGGCIWTDGTNTYYSSGSNQYKLNGTTWTTMSWTGPSLFAPYGNKIWTDGTNIYYSDQNFQCKLNGTTWETMTWTGLASFQGDQVWTDGTNIYYSYNGSSLSGQYKLNGTTWESMTWTGLTSFNGSEIWTDGTDFYYSYNSTQYKLNGTTWEAMTWTGLASFFGSGIWSDGSDVYYSYQSAQYKLDGTTWESMIWDGLTSFNGGAVWTDGNNYYYSSGSNQYIINTKAKDGTEAIYYKDVKYSDTSGVSEWGDITGTLSNQIDLQAALDEKAIAVRISQPEYDALPMADKNDPSKIYFLNSDEGYLEEVTFPGRIYENEMMGYNIWTDGANVYYSNDSYQYKFDGSTWSTMTWSGYLYAKGEHVWTDGENYYYSYNTNHYKLNGTTWESMTWSGLTNFKGYRVWTDGTNIYYSSGSDQYKLNGTTWESMSWTGLSINLYGEHVWTDGTDTYYSYNANHYKLNGTTWEAITTWPAITNFYGRNIWTNGTNIYYSNGSDQYKFNGTTWEAVAWDGDISDFYGSDVWNYGDDYYHSFRNTDQKICLAPAGIYYRDTLYASEGSVILSNTFAANANSVDIDINSLNVNTNNYTLKYFSSVQGLDYSTTSYNSSTGIFTVYFKHPASSNGVFCIEAHKVN